MTYKYNLIKSGGGTGPVKPDNRHSHSNVSVSIPAEYYLFWKIRKKAKFKAVFLIQGKTVFCYKLFSKYIN